MKSQSGLPWIVIALLEVQMECSRPASSGLAHIASNLTSIHSHGHARREHELSTGDGKTSKALLIFVTALGLNVCGLDRCCAGQLFIGLAKGITLGGGFVFMLFDWVLLVSCCIFRSTSLESLGWNVKFTQGCQNDDWTQTMGFIVLLSQGPLFVLIIYIVVRGPILGGQPLNEASVFALAQLRKGGILSSVPGQFEIDQAFKDMDANKTGSINADELKKGLERLGVQVSDDQVSQLIDASDKNADGKINKDELEDLFLKEGATLAKKAN